LAWLIEALKTQFSNVGADDVFRHPDVSYKNPGEAAARHENETTPDDGGVGGLRCGNHEQHYFCATCADLYAPAAPAK